MILSNYDRLRIDDKTSGVEGEAVNLCAKNGLIRSRRQRPEQAYRKD